MAPEGHIYIGIKPKYAREEKIDEVTKRVASLKNIKSVETFYFDPHNVIARFKTSDDYETEKLVNKIGSMEEVNDVRLKKVKRRIKSVKKSYKIEDL